MDYFSPSAEVEPEDIGAGLNTLCFKYLDGKNRKSKFTYEDSWGDIVLRNEAWLCIKNLIPQIEISHPTDILHEIISQQEMKSRLNFRELDLTNTTMSRFYENIINELLKNKAQI